MTTSRIVMSVIGGVLVLLGAALLLGGVWLIGLGGSWFYAVSGILLTLSGYGFIRQRALGFWAAILLLPSSVVWALSEVGVDFWQLVPTPCGVPGYRIHCHCIHVEIVQSQWNPSRGAIRVI
ncbi:hypothetical protein [Xenorhabdus bovienii]|uniref:hypothetical protein n=1 Tax=Xenorhabdus bovienii TaxID=40576 RepID=UPI003DA2282C